MMKIKVMLQVENPRLNEEINIASIRQKLNFTNNVPHNFEPTKMLLYDFKLSCYRCLKNNMNVLNP